MCAPRVDPGHQLIFSVVNLEEVDVMGGPHSIHKCVFVHKKLVSEISSE